MQKNRLSFILASLFIASCSQLGIETLAKTDEARSGESKPAVETGEVSQEPKIERPRIEVLHPKDSIIHNGHVRYFEFKTVALNQEFELFCQGVKIPYGQKGDGIYFAYLAQNYFLEKGQMDCQIKIPGKKKDLLSLNIKPYGYKEEHLQVSSKHVTLSSEDQQRANREAVLLEKIYSVTQPRPLYDSEFALPIDSFRTSIYGNRRVFNNVKKTQHLGNDFRAAIGVEIPASNKGIVVLAQDLFYSGKTVIIDHGIGIFTMYGHLSQIDVTEGQQVEKKEVIGLSGDTGRVSGPHLHWGVKVQGHWVDGMTLIQESQKQFL